MGVAVGLYMAFGKTSWRLGESLPQGAARAATGTGVGLLSVLMGIGGGTFGVPLMSLFNVPIHRAVATAAGFGVIIALPSAALFLFTPTDAAPPLTVGAVNLPAFGITIAMTLLTTPLGVKLAHAMDPQTPQAGLRRLHHDRGAEHAAKGVPRLIRTAGRRQACTRASELAPSGAAPDRRASFNRTLLQTPA